MIRFPSIPPFVPVLLALAGLAAASAEAQPPDRGIPMRMEGNAAGVDSVQVDLLLFSGEMALEGGDHEGAADAFRRALEMDPANQEAHLLLGRALAMQVLNDDVRAAEAMQRGAEAHREFRTVLDGDPENVEAREALRLLALRFSDRGRPDVTTDRGRLLCEQADSARAGGSLEEARGMLMEAVRIEPAVPGLHRELGEVERELGIYDEALARFETALRLNPNDLRARADHGLTLAAAGRNEDALDELSLAFRIDGEMTEVAEALIRVLEHRGDDLSPMERTTLGRAYGAVGDWARAETTLAPAVSDSSSLTERRALALSRYFQDEVAEAISLLTGIHRDYPDDLETVYYLGAAYLRAGEAELGRRYLHAVVAVDPQNANALKLLGLSLSEEAGREDESIALLVRADRLGAEIEHLPCLLGMLYARAEEPEEAWRHFRACEEADPAFPPALLGLGTLAADRGDPGQTIVYLERYLALEPKDPRAIVRLGVAYLRVGREEEAYRTLEGLAGPGSPFADPEGKTPGRRQLLEISAFLLATVRSFDDAIFVGETLVAEDPDNAGYQNNLAMAYADADLDAARAHELALAATRAEPDNPGHLDTLGWVLVRLGRYDEAEIALKQSIEKSRSLPEGSLSEVYYHLAVLYRATDRHELADDALDRALENPPTPQLRREMEKLLRD